SIYSFSSFHDPATSEIYTLSLHDALPISDDAFVAKLAPGGAVAFSTYLGGSGDDVALAVSLDSEGAIYITGFTDSTDFLTETPLDRKSTRLNSSHDQISYAVFCLKKKKNK